MKRTPFKRGRKLYPSLIKLSLLIYDFSFALPPAEKHFDSLTHELRLVFWKNKFEIMNCWINRNEPFHFCNFKYWLILNKLNKEYLTMYAKSRFLKKREKYSTLKVLVRLWMGFNGHKYRLYDHIKYLCISNCCSVGADIPLLKEVLWVTCYCAFCQIRFQ